MFPLLPPPSWVRKKFEGVSKQQNFTLIVPQKFRSPLIDSYPPLCWACFYTTSSGLGLVKTILGPSAVARTGQGNERRGQDRLRPQVLLIRADFSAKVRQFNRTLVQTIQHQTRWHSVASKTVYDDRARWLWRGQWVKHPNSYHYIKMLVQN